MPLSKKWIGFLRGWAKKIDRFCDWRDLLDQSVSHQSDQTGG